MSSPRTPRGDELGELFSAIFAEADLRRFVTGLPYPRNLGVELKGSPVSLRELAHDAAGLLERNCLVDRQLCERLIAEVPGQRARIEHTFGVVTDPVEGPVLLIPSSGGPVVQADIFIGHETPDLNYAQSLKKYLESAGHSCFLAVGGVSSSQDWTDLIPARLRGGRAAVFVLRGAVKSLYLKDEIRIAIELSKERGPRNFRIYLVFIGDDKIYPFGTGSFQSCQGDPEAACRSIDEDLRST